MAAAIAASDPLVIDLSSGHTGVTLTEFDASTTTTFFDMRGDGFAQQTAWISGDTGFLVRDVNENGQIDDITEMFGSAAGDGFSQLAALDSNHDLRIDSNDEDWDTLQVWVDENGDAVTQEGELYSLGDVDIVSIDLAGVTSSSSTIDGNAVSHTSTVTFVGGGTAAIADVWLANDRANTYYNEEYELDTDTLLMPYLRGYGEVADLTIAMSLDSTLKGLVEGYVTAFVGSGFAMTDFVSDFNDILYRWAGVDGVSSSSRGPNIDARQLEFLEQLLGMNFIQDGILTNPVAGAVTFLNEAWLSLSRTFQAHVLLQVGAAALFENEVTYNPWTGDVSGDLDLSEDAIGDLADDAPGDPEDNVAYWTAVGTFLDMVVGLDNITVTEAGWLDATIYATNNNLTWTNIVDIVHDVHTTNTLNGTGGTDTLTGDDRDDTINGYADADTLSGDRGNDTIYGGDGNDTLNGGDGQDELWGENGNNTLNGNSGNDVLHGYSENDTLSGGAGGNMLYGGEGDDIYVYTAEADDLIQEAAGTDELRLPSGITSGDLTFSRVDAPSGGSYFDDLLITIDGGGSIQIVNQLSGSSSYYVETLRFYDNSTLNLTTLTNVPVYLSDGDDNIAGTLGSGATIVYALGGNDTVLTNTGNDTLDGGAGNDYLKGSTGNDTYLASIGFDRIYDTGGTDTIVIPAAYAPSDVILYRGGGHSLDDLIMVIQGMGEIRVEYQFQSSGYVIEDLYFLYNSSTVDLTGQPILTVGTDGGDYLTAPSISAAADATIYGYAGNDTIIAGSGNDTIHGGAGNDSMTGGTGNDLYIFSPTFGNDTVIESASSGSDTLHFSGIDPNDVRMWTDSYGYLYLQDSADTSHYITVQASTNIYTTESTVGERVESVTFDASYSTTWDLTAGLTLRGDPSSGGYIYGTAYGDTITGGSGTDHLYGNGGNDILIGAAGNDSLSGNTGNDTYKFSSGFGNATVLESSSEGTDTIRFVGIDPSNIRMWSDYYGYFYLQDMADTSHYITIQAGLTGSGMYESTVGQYVESVTFDAGYSTTWDLTTGLALTGTTGTEQLYGTAYGDTINGMGGSDTVYGNGGNDAVHGGSGSDTMYGGGGNDILRGNGGTDNLYGESGADTFLFMAATALSASDNIQDFSTGAGDKIDLSDVISAFDPLTDAITDWVQITTSGSDSLVKVDTDGATGGANWQQIATIIGVTGLTDEAALVTNGNLIAHA